MHSSKYFENFFICSVEIFEPGLKYSLNSSIVLNKFIAYSTSSLFLIKFKYLVRADCRLLFLQKLSVLKLINYRSEKNSLWILPIGILFLHVSRKLMREISVSFSFGHFPRFSVILECNLIFTVCLRTSEELRLGRYFEIEKTSGP